MTLGENIHISDIDCIDGCEIEEKLAAAAEKADLDIGSASFSKGFQTMLSVSSTVWTYREDSGRGWQLPVVFTVPMI